uniref:Uncharacterized protein n=1 Tax=Oryza barthii TaxID=65489 RepID=A0A0D3GLC4_9ORYZ
MLSSRPLPRRLRASAGIVLRLPSASGFPEVSTTRVHVTAPPWGAASKSSPGPRPFAAAPPPPPSAVPALPWTKLATVEDVMPVAEDLAAELKVKQEPVLLFLALVAYSGSVNLLWP